MITKTGDRITAFGQMEKHLWHGGYLRGEDSDLVYCKRANGIIYAIDGESFGAGWVATDHNEKTLWAKGAVFACDAPTRPIDPETAIRAQEKRERERRAESKNCIASNGYLFPTGDALRLHLNKGGHVMINGRGPHKWYRMRANLLECLYENSSQWESSAWELDQLVALQRVVACDEPQLSKDIAERDRVISAIGDRGHHVRFTEKPNPLLDKRTRNPCKCAGCTAAADGIGIISTTYNEEGLSIAIYGHGSILMAFLNHEKVAMFHAEMSLWLEASGGLEK